MPCV